MNKRLLIFVLLAVTAVSYAQKVQEVTACLTAVRALEYTKSNRHYLFFKIKGADSQERQYVDEYTKTCKRSSEPNQIYIAFSPQTFAKTADNATAELLPQELGFEDF